MSKTKSSGLVRLAIGREAEVEELYALVKSGKSIYVYGMPSSGVEKIIADVCCALRKGNVREINVSMCSIGEGKHTENGIATLILDECGESYREPITMSAVVRALPKIAKGHRIIFRIEHFDEIHKEEDARIFCRLIELVNNELNGEVSFVLSGHRIPQSKIFTMAGVSVQLGELEHYPIEPFRGHRVQQYLETMYGVNSIDERKLSRIIEATAGDPLLIERLAKLGFETDWRIALRENEKLQRGISNFVKQVVRIYGDEVLFDGETMVKDVWRGKEVVGYNDDLSAIGVLPCEEYKLPGIFVAYMVALPPSSSSRKAPNEATDGSPLGREGKKKRAGAGGQSQLQEGEVCDVETEVVRGVLKLIKSKNNGKKQLLQVENCGEIICGYKITNANHWRLIDRLVKKNRRSARADEEEEGWSRYQPKEVEGLMNGHGSQGGFEDGITYKGARDFWKECVSHETHKGVPVACIPKRKI